jgi:hypothetical protein
MKTLIKYLVISFFITSSLFTQNKYQFRNIRDIQFKPIDSLLVADQLQNTNPSQYTLQSANFVGDTVTVVGVCIIPAQVLRYTAGGYTMVIADTGYDGPFGTIFLRASIAAGDTISYSNMLNVEKGDIVRISAKVWEFPGPGETSSGYPTMNSMTQLIPLRDPNFEIIGQGTVPAIKKLETSDFYEGVFTDKIKFSTGEQYESGYVELTGLTVVSTLNGTNGTVNLVDDNGNMISTYDGSKWWTLRTFKDPNSPYKSIFQINTRIDTIRGWITTVTGGENSRGYRISPVETTDVKIGVPRPSIFSVRRYPVIVATDSTPRIEAVVRPGPGGANISNRLLFYSVDNGPYSQLDMQVINGDTCRATIPVQPYGSFIKYYIKVQDLNGYVSISANGAGGGLGTDTTKGFYFYKVTDGNLTIHDAQYTPYLNGRSPYVGAVTTISGIVTADTSDLPLSAKSTGGTPVWYMQSGNEPASGIWFNGSINSLMTLRKGDSVAVTGTIQEQFDVTRIGLITAVQVVTSSNLLPSPVKLTTGIFSTGAGNGDLNAEPYEGMLVQFDTVTIANANPTYQEYYECTVDDGSGNIMVRMDGLNHYSVNPVDSVTEGIKILKVGDKFSQLTGIMYYSFNRYKICPRTDSDFGTYIPLSVNDKIDGPIPTSYTLSNNYPNPFNPSTIIEYGLPKEDKVVLKIYNVIGQEVVTLKNEIQRAGRYRVTFNASKLASGVYFYRLQTGNFNQIKKMLLVK